MSSTLRRRVRARTKKTGESYQTALRNYLKTHPKKESRSAEVTPSEATTSASVFDLVLESLAEVRPTPPPPTPEEEAARKERLWTNLKKGVRKQLPPRAAARLIEKLQKKDLSIGDLRNAVNYLSVLPRGYLSQEQEWIRQQVRQVTPILEQAAAMRPILEQAATVPDVVRHAQEMSNLIENSLPIVEATRQAIDEFSAGCSAAAEIESSLGAAQEVLDAVRATPARHPEASVAAALKELETGPVAAALRYLNEGPAAEARRYLEERAVNAALRSSQSDALNAVMRRHESSGLTHARKGLWPSS